MKKSDLPRKICPVCADCLSYGEKMERNWDDAKLIAQKNADPRND